MFQTNRIIQHNVREGFPMIPDSVVNCTVTSPPYYGKSGAYGDSYCNGSNFLNSFNCVNEFASICFRDTFSVRITSHSINIPQHDNFLKEDIFISFFGVERVFIKKRNNDFCKVFNLFNSKGYAWLSGTFSLVHRYDTTVEVIFNEMDNISIINSDLETNLQSVFGIFPAFDDSGENINTTLAIKKTAQPVTEGITNIKSYWYSITQNSSFESIVDVNLINDSVPLTKAFDSAPCLFGNLEIRKSRIKHIYFGFNDLAIDFTSSAVAHISYLKHTRIYEDAGVDGWDSYNELNQKIVI